MEMSTDDFPQALIGAYCRILARTSVVGSGCWIWTGGLAPNGYGGVSVLGKRVATHRIVYRVRVGPIPDGYHIDHVKARGCTSTACVRPSHLEAVTPRENTIRGVGASAKNAAKTHCFAGHPLSGDNLYLAPNTTKRGCHACLDAYYPAHREEVLTRVRGAYVENREKILAYQKEYGLKHKEQKRAYDRARRLAGKYTRPVASPPPE